MGPKIYKKLIINEWFKEYYILDVTKKCFDSSPEIESAGCATGFKIHSLQDLEFRVNELKRLNFTLDTD